MKRLDPRVAHALQLPPVSQIGIVVERIEDAAAYFEDTLGIGPWYAAVMRHSSVERNGEAIDARFDIALAYSGPIQFELIEPRGGAPTIYDEHLDTNDGGLHHLGFCVSKLDHYLSRAKAAGIGILQRGVIKTGGGAVTTYAYLDTAASGGVIVELIQTTLLGVPVGMSPALFRVGRLTGEVEPLRR